MNRPRDLIQTSSSILSDAAGFGKWLAWGVTFFVASATPFIALKDAARAETRNVQHHATTLTAPLTAIGFFVFLLAPSILQAGWGWVPHF